MHVEDSPLLSCYITALFHVKMLNPLYVGLLALGHLHGLNSAHPGEPNDLAIAEDLMRTCYEMYRRTPTGLAPELAFFETSEAGHSHSVQITAENSGGGDFIIKPNVSHLTLKAVIVY